MALPQLTSADAGAAARAKINAGIAEADKVSGLAAILAALQVQLAPYTDLVGSDPNRPGDAKTLFTRVMTGSPKLRPAIDKGTIENGGDLGQVLRISGADTDPGLGYIDVAPRRIYHVRPGRAYLVHYEFARFQDPTDPEQNALELRLQNLNANFSQVSNVRLGDAYAPTTGNGAFFIDIFIGKAGAPGTPIYTVPNTACYVVPFFRVYGNGQQTDLGAVRLYDVSDALAGGADIASIIARVAKLEVSQSSNVIYATNWATDLSPRSGRIAGAGAEVQDSDTGSHTDPVTGATVPNAGKYQWSVSPAGWKWVGISNARQAALFIGQGIPTVTAEKIASLLFIGVDPATGAIADASAADFVTFIKGLTMDPITYSSEPPGLTAELTSKVILPPDDQRKNFQIQCPTHDLAIRWDGGKASFDRDPIIYAGTIVDWMNKGKEAVSVIARPAELRTVTGAAIPAPIRLSQDRLVPGYISGSFFGDQVLSAYPNQEFKKSYRAVLRDQINKLNDLGALAKGTIFTAPVHARENLIVNLANPGLPMTLVEPTTAGRLVLVPYKSVASGGDSYIRSGLATAASLGITADGHFFAVQADANAAFETGIGIAGNSSSLLIKPNAASGKAGVRAGGAQVVIDAAATAWIGMNRTLLDRFTAYVEAAGTDYPQTLATADREFTILAVNTSSNVTPTISNQKLRGLWLGYGLQSSATALAIRDAMKAIFAAADAAAAA